MQLSEKQKELLHNKVLSYSSLKAFKKSPQHFAQYALFKTPATPAMELGKALDKMILSPKEFKKEYALMDQDVKLNTKEGKAIMEKFEKANKGKIVIRKSDADYLNNMNEALMANDIGRRTIEAKGTVQKEVFWTDKETGLKFRGFLDKDLPDYTLDMKTGADISPNKFMRDAANLDYPLQGAMYQLAKGRLYSDKPFLYVCIESKPPHGVAVYQATNDYLTYGYNEYKRLIAQFKRCKDEDLWHMSYDFWSPMDYHYLDIPGYLKHDL